MDSILARIPQCIRRRWTARIANEAGQDLVEYALIIVLVAIMIAAALGIFGDDLGAVYNRIAATIPT